MIYEVIAFAKAAFEFQRRGARGLSFFVSRNTSIRILRGGDISFTGRLKNLTPMSDEVD